MKDILLMLTLVILYTILSNMDYNDYLLANGLQ